MKKFHHLTLDDRRNILSGIMSGASKSDIAETIGVDRSTIGKEIKLHRFRSYKCNLPLECSNYKTCPFGRNCTKECPSYAPFHCTRRDHSPGVCNGCPNWSRCRFDKYRYVPETAQKDYEATKIDSREGVNLTTSEAKRISDIVAPLLRQGQSPYHILSGHPELGICEKTLYNYIEQGVLKELNPGVTVMNLRRQVSRKITKKRKNLYKKRTDSRYLRGRTYNDYLKFIQENPDTFVVQMDTVYNDESNGPFIQTFKFVEANVLFAVLHEKKDAESMLQGVNTLEKMLGKDIFRKYAGIILTDRGTEFVLADSMETDTDGTSRTHLFYCDPMRSGQKGTLENNHIELRYILPKGYDLRSLGLVKQADLNLVLSNVNSISIEKLGGKTPLELADFAYHDLYEKLVEFGIHKIEKDRVVLKPYLLKK